MTAINGKLVSVDDQPIAASFFGEGQWLTDFITPEASDVQELYSKLTKGIYDVDKKIAACWHWVANQVKYVYFVKGKIWVGGTGERTSFREVSVQGDLWTMPSMTIQTKVGNCAVKSFLLTSLLRNALPPNQVYCALGNLYNGKPGGHAWVAIKQLGQEYISESTTPNVPVMVPADTAKRYEAVHYFNDKEVLAVEGKTQMIPMTACYSSWLSDYLNWAYIESQ